MCSLFHFFPNCLHPRLYCSCLSQCKSKTWCNLLQLWKESVKSNHMRQAAFYMLLARQQRTLPVTCITFLMLVSVLTVCAKCGERSFRKLLCLEENLLVGLAPLTAFTWTWDDGSVRLARTLSAPKTGNGIRPLYHIWGTWFSLGLLLCVHVATLSRRRCHLHFLLQKCLFLVPCTLVLCSI